MEESTILNICTAATMWKFRNFLAILILREITFGQVRSKPAILIILEALNLDGLAILLLKMSEISKNLKFIAAKVVK